jgi:hypothetical protein
MADVDRRVMAAGQVEHDVLQVEMAVVRSAAGGVATDAVAQP